jgi:hypothetical protein
MLFRNEIFDDIQNLNPDYDKLTLFKKTQKLLDRFLFIFFAEDRLLVPPNSIDKIVTKWKDDVAFGDVKPLYSIFKQYFNVLNIYLPIMVVCLLQMTCLTVLILMMIYFISIQLT